MAELKHGRECFPDDDPGRSLCESIYAQKCDALEDVLEIVRALYVLCGEHPEAQRLVAEAEKIR